MGLYHNIADHGFMCTSDVIAAAGTPANPFPGNIQWTYHADNLKQLRHYPDPFVRPGGVAFGSASTTTPPITPTDLEVESTGLELRGDAAARRGADRRAGARRHRAGQPRRPADARAAEPQPEERVRPRPGGDPAGTARTFRTVVRCIEDHPMRDAAARRLDRANR